MISPSERVNQLFFCQVWRQ